MTTQKEEEHKVRGVRRTVVIAIDDSQYSEHAFDFYINNIKRSDDTVVLVHVPEFHNILHQSVVFTDTSTVAALVEEENKRIQVLLKKYTEKMQKANIGGKLRENVGKVGETIISIADEENADLLVVGSRGLGKFRRTVLGSVSDYCLHHSHAPVLVCRMDH